MSLPRENLDQLLSGYLDDALSVDEQAQFEQWLRSDPAVAAELSEFRQLQSSVRQSLRRDRGSLGPDFANRVIEAAMAQAQMEGLGDDHPLMRLAEQPASPVNRRRENATLRLATVVATLAASLLFVLYLTRSPQEPLRQGIGEIAQLPSPDADSLVDAGGDLTRRAPDLDASAEPFAAADQVADSERSAAGDRHPDLEQPSDRLAATNRLPEPVTQGRAEPGEGPVAADLAAIATTTGPREAMPAPETPAAPSSMDQAILVVEVKRTATGRASLVIQRALRQAGLEAESQRPASSAIVRAVRRSVGTSADESGSLLYLEASAKQLDQFTMALVEDVQGIEAIGWNIVFDAPVLEAIDTMPAIDPTTVRQSSAWPIVNAQGEPFDPVFDRLDRQDYLPLRASEGSLAAAGLTIQDGADVRAKLLVLVR